MCSSDLHAIGQLVPLWHPCRNRSSRPIGGPASAGGRLSTLASRSVSRSAILSSSEALIVWRHPIPQPPPVKGQPGFVASDPTEGPEPLVVVWRDGSVTALCGHVDLGTGLRTALTQIVAEELDVPMTAVHLIMGSTQAAPNQGATIASASIQIHAEPLRRAAAQARSLLAQQLATRWACLASDLQLSDGVFSHGTRQAEVGAAVPEGGLKVELDLATPVKPAHLYRLVGLSVPRVDIPAKANGEPAFVHDIRWPGVLHGRVIRPPYASADHGDFIGHTLEGVDQSSIGHKIGRAHV